MVHGILCRERSGVGQALWWASGADGLAAPYYGIIPMQVYESGPHFVHHGEQMEGLEAGMAGEGAVPRLTGILTLGTLRASK